MSNTYTQPQKAIVLWLSGVRLEDIGTLPEVTALRERGAMVELEPTPITGARGQYFQAFSGRSPASFGFFDTMVPHGYTVKEEVMGRGDTPGYLPDVLRSVGWHVSYEEAQFSNLVGSVQHWIQTASEQTSCLIVRCSLEIEDARGMQAYLPTIAQALSSAQAWVGETGLLALLSDRQPAHVERFVNLNNFLAEMGVLERDEQSHLINWSNSLAYFAGHGQLWLNLLGRDSEGAVHPQDEAEEVRETLIKALPAKLRDPQSGKPVIERVYRKEELYSGEYLFCASDLVVVFAPGYAPSPRSTFIDFDEEIFTTPAADEYASAGVNPSLVKGALLASAPVLAPSVSATEQAPLTAVVPTLLHALGIEYVGMESPAIAALFSPAYLEKHPIRASSGDQGLSDDDEELIINRLRDLGYV